MDKIRKTLDDKVYEWNPKAYGKGAWFSVGKNDKLSLIKKETQAKLGRPDPVVPVAQSPVKTTSLTKNTKKLNPVVEEKQQNIDKVPEVRLTKEEREKARDKKRRDDIKLLNAKRDLIKTKIEEQEIKLKAIQEKEESKKLSREEKEKRQAERIQRVENLKADRLQKEEDRKDAREKKEQAKLEKRNNVAERKSARSEDSDESKSVLKQLIDNNFNKKQRIGRNINKSFGNRKRNRNTYGSFSRSGTAGMSMSSDLDIIMRGLTGKLIKKLSGRKEEQKERRDPFHTKISGKDSKVKKGDPLADVMAKMYSLTVKTEEDRVKREEVERDLKAGEDEKQQKFLKDSLNPKQKNTTTKKEVSPEIQGVHSLFEGVFSFLGDIVEFLAAKKLASSLGNIIRSSVPILGSGVLAALPAIVLGTMGVLGKNIQNSQESNMAKNNDRRGVESSVRMSMGPDANEDTIKAAVDEIMQRDNPSYSTGTVDTELRGGIPAEKIDDQSGQTKQVTNADGTYTPIPSTSTSGPVLPASTATKESETYKSPLNDKEEEAFNKYNEELDKRGKPPINIEELKDPKMKELWKKSVEFRGYLEKTVPEVKPDVVPQSNNSTDERLQKVSANFDQGQSGGTTNLVVNSPSTNVYNSGGGGVILEKLTGVRTDDPTLKKIQKQNFRWV